MSQCPCCSGKSYEECCGPIIEGTPAPTPEALMRSRYSAYALGHIDHVRDTLLLKHQAEFDEEGARSWSQESEWLGLEIHNAEGGPDDRTGVVEFTARYRQEGQDVEHRERALFGRENGVWKYVDGKVKGAPTIVKGDKVGRNDPCPCGSGKKYKKCCGR